MTRPYLSSYVYADNRPTVLTDPSGLRPGGGMWEEDPAVQSFSNDNTCGSIWCFIKSSEGQDSIRCGLFLGGTVTGVGLMGFAVTTFVRGGIGAAAGAYRTHLGAHTLSAGALGGGYLNSGGIPCF